MQEGQTSRLARYVTELKFSDLPADVVERAKWLTLNILGCSLRGLSIETTNIAFRTLKEFGGKEQSTVFGGGCKLPAPHAAAVNATAAWSLMNDDTHLEGVFHPGHGVVAGGIAIGELEHVTGEEFLLAAVAAFEVSCRIASSLTGDIAWSKSTQGWYCNIADTFCSAIVTGKLLKLSKDELSSAIGLAAGAASEFLEVGEPPSDAPPIRGGPSSWPWGGGKAAMLGVMATLLARNGIRTSETVLESGKGYCRIFTAGNGDLNRLVEGLGQTYETKRIAIKRRCNSQMVHAAIDAAQSIVIKHNIEPREIAKIIIRGPYWFPRYLSSREVADFSGAALSLPYSIAVAILDRSNMTLADQVYEHLDDPEAKDLMGKFEVVEDPIMSEAFAKNVWPAGAEIRTVDGRSYEEEIWHSKGEFPENPLSESELDYKFRTYAGSVLQKPKVDAIMAAVKNLEKMDDISELSDLLRGD